MIKYWQIWEFSNFTLFITQIWKFIIFTPHGILMIRFGNLHTCRNHHYVYLRCFSELQNINFNLFSKKGSMEPVLHIDALCGAIRGMCFHMLYKVSGHFHLLNEVPFSSIIWTVLLQLGIWTIGLFLTPCYNRPAFSFLTSRQIKLCNEQNNEGFFR
jgi:ABC-type multidrug transport system fused ATPase/permease subunit